MKGYLVLIVVGLIVFGCFTGLGNTEKVQTVIQKMMSAPSPKGYTSHAPIQINNDTDLTNQFANRTVWGLEINGIGYGYCIYIGNCSQPFAVTDCFLTSGVQYGGVYLKNCTHGAIAYNNCSSDSIGIYLDSSHLNSVTNNICYQDSYAGILLSSSGYNTFLNNELATCCFLVEGNNLPDFNTQKIGVDNSVNGKPVQYWENQTTGTVPSGAGEIMLANCSNVTVTNQHMSNVSVGIQLAFSSYCQILSNNCSSDFMYGIYLGYSTHNLVSGDNCYSNSYYGIYLYYSTYNTVTSDFSISNYFGIELDSSDYNTVTNNTCPLNSYGLYLDYSNNNAVSNNSCAEDTAYGLYAEYSNVNKITFNTLSQDSYGIYLFGSITDNFTFNNMVNCGLYITGGNALDYDSHYIDSSNTVNGKPVQYAKNQTGGKVPEGAGEVILANCYQVLVANESLDNGSVGMEVAFTTNCVITNNILYADYWDGIDVESSTSDFFTGNRMVQCGLTMTGSGVICYATHVIHPDNTVNGKPLQYFKNQTGGTVPLGAGEVILANCVNVTVQNQNLSDTSMGIEAVFSSNCKITGTSCYSERMFCMELGDFSGGTIADDICSASMAGVYLVSGNYNTVTNNVCQADEVGIVLSSSNSNNVTYNNCTHNSYFGIEIAGSNDNLVVYNYMGYNKAYGLYIDRSSYNRIHHNIFMYNYNGYRQAYDYEGANFWNTSGSPHGYGNYWSDWCSPDNNSDGIVDYPYFLDGGAGARDYFPIAWSPPGIPETTLSPFPLIIISIIIFTAIVVRLRKR